MRWFAAFVLFLAAVPAAAQGGEVINLWPGVMPGSGKPAGPEVDGLLPLRRGRNRDEKQDESGEPAHHVPQNFLPIEA